MARRPVKRAATKRRVNVSRAAESTGTGDPFASKADQVETALATGEQAGLLEDLFGPAQYAELQRLAKEAEYRSRRGGPRVLILPGIMGSTLGYPRAGWFDDAIWLDFMDIGLGKLGRLSLASGDAKIKPLGVILIAYLALKLRLRIAGFDVDFHPFDWRQSVEQLGRDLAKRIGNEPHDKVHLVAHSMGGLVSRASLAAKPAKLGRIVTLGTPNFGSFSPIQAFRGAHSIVNKLAFIDLHHSRQQLTDVFGGFPGLCQMIPAADKVGADYFDLASWPTAGTRPAKALLDAARKVQQNLPANPPDLVQIIGVNRETVVSAKLDTDKDELVFTTSLDGDGTVPRICATLPGAARTYYIEEEHGGLPNNSLLAKAVEAILKTGATNDLPDHYESRRAGPLRSIPESQLREPAFEGTRGRALSQRERRSLLREFAAPDDSAAPATASQDVATEAATPAFADRVVIGRQRQHRLDITLVHGSLTEVEAAAYVLGLFRNVAPGGAARAVDNLMDGALEQMLQRRMFNANIGEISTLPCGRHLLRADFVSFVGLGAFDEFKDEVLEIVGENLVRTFVTARVDNFATVPFGGASGRLTSASLLRLLTGFLRGLADTDQEQRFRGITICETDAERFEFLRGELYRLCATQLFDGVEVTLREKRLSPSVTVLPITRAAPRPAELVYLIARHEVDNKERAGFSVSVLTAGAKAAIYKGWKALDKKRLDAMLEQLPKGDLKLSQLPKYGRDMAALILPDSVRTILQRYPEHHLVVVHDTEASRIPWETLHIGDWSPALAAGLSHRYEAQDLSVAKWLEQRQKKPMLSVLLVIDPSSNLDGAVKEGDRILELFKKMNGAVKVTELRQGAARRSKLLELFNSGDFDMIHYAGHAFFDEVNRGRSGILCADDEVLSGADLAALSKLPSLVFFNACEAARIRKQANGPGLKSSQSLRGSVGFAEAFLRGGVANYIGTYWPVSDRAAEAFATTFYQSLLAGRSLGATMQESRKAVHARNEFDWADYIHYGDPEFVLKQADGR